MENQKKIISLFLFCLTVWHYSCREGNHSPVKNKSLLEYNSSGRLALVYMDLENYDTVFVDSLQADGSLVTLQGIIDPGTFDLLCNFPEDSIKIDNPYYNRNPNFNYYRDKNNLYFLHRDSQQKPELVKMCSVGQYSIPGGEYLRIRNTIYHRAREVKGADVATFRTIKAFRKDAEPEFTLGVDKEHVYLGNMIITPEQAKDFHFPNEIDSLLPLPN